MDGNIVSANTRNVHKFALQQKARSILFVVVIVVPVFIGAVAYIAYTNMTGTQDTANLDGSATLGNPEGIDPANTSESTQVPNTEITPPAPPSVDTPNQSSGGGTQGAASALPPGLTTALNSIEANGIKGSAYVSSSLDTSSIPDGSSVTFDRSSWSKESETAGTIKGTLYIYGQPQNGSVRFVETGGVWRATGYSTN